MDMAKLRAFWAHRQGLDGSLRGEDPATVLERAGWARSVGGVGPYVTLFARAGTSRAAADAAVKALQIHELPAARGCTYVVPASDFALALRAGQEFGDGEMRVAAKLGVTEKEVDTLCAAVVRALGDAPALDPDAIRAATGKASRSLGEAGRKKGLTTTLPLALGRLQRRGAIRRVPVNGRLDQQRYAYSLFKPNPLAKDTRATGDAMTEMARRYFRWVGPAKPGEFAWFAGLGVRATKEAIDPLGLVPAEPGSDRLLLPEDVAPFRAFKTPSKPQYALVSSLDAIAAARRDVASLLDAKDAGRKVVADKIAVPVGGLSDLPSHAILDRGRLVGLWEFDPEAGAIIRATFGPADKSLEAAIRETEGFVRDQLGDARSFSLDSPKSRAPRLKSLREFRPAP
ncbi:MAG TPA: crosslink repair DNA glycosylase YcaQ family protein [Patescibacteria group bacterium]|nr:crosslink repair DNA glycosylase YcaQ family protein [Patescibacteria group bacterium]